jgi:hypothetical protein
MAVTMRWFTRAPLNIKGSEWTANDLRAVLLDSTLNLLTNQDVYDFWNDISTEELPTANGYTVNGVALASKTITQDDATNEQRFDAADVSWVVTGAGITWRWLVIVDRTPGTDATRPLWGFGDPGADQAVPAGQTQEIRWSSSPAALLKTAA